jgi:hypothetical protein
MYTVHTVATGTVTDEEFIQIISPFVKSETAGAATPPLNAHSWGTALPLAIKRANGSCGSSLNDYPDPVSTPLSLPLQPSVHTPMLGFTLPPPNTPPPGYSQLPAFTMDAFCNGVSSITAPRSGPPPLPPFTEATPPPPYDAGNSKALHGAVLKSVKVSPYKVFDLRGSVLTGSPQQQGPVSPMGDVSPQPSVANRPAKLTPKGAASRESNFDDHGPSSERDEL